jgi:UDP-glucose 4-epimerase
VKLLVTGGCGFVGSNLTHALANLGHEVVVLDDLSTGLKSNLKGLNVEIIEDSILNVDKYRNDFKDLDAIFHLGARGSVPRSIKNPILTHEVNATATLRILELARLSGTHVIFSSSSSVYGRNGDLPKNEKMWLSPITPYAASKLAGEGYVQAYAGSYEVPVTLFRFFNIFGPRQRPDHDYAAVIPKWIWSAMNNETIQVFGDGEQTRDFTYVDTVLNTLIKTVEEKIVSADPINLAFGNRISLNQVIALLKGHFPNLQVNFQGIRSGDVQHSQNDPKLINQLFSNIEITGFEDALNRTVEWLQQNHTQIVGGPKVVD